MKKTIIPAIIAKSQKELDERIKKVSSNIYQLDIMDGKFVKNKSLMFNFSLLKGKKYEAHLMIKNPESWILKNWKKIDMIIFHLESTKNPEVLIKIIKSKKRRVGIAINPNTSFEKLEPYINKIDMVLIMTVNPGKYGSKFLPKTIEKIKKLRKLKPKLNIEVDGGIDIKTIKLVNKMGVNRFVVGSYLQKSEDPKKAIDALRKIIK